jgi:hypothetical protein
MIKEDGFVRALLEKKNLLTVSKKAQCKKEKV